MKKVLSVLLAVCMLAALAVPALAWGNDADVVKAEFDKAEYSLSDILTDNGGINVAELLTCYDKNNNRVMFDDEGKTTADIRAFNSSNNEVLTLTNVGTVTKIMNNKPTEVKVTLRVTLASGVQASTVIVVPANISASGTSGTAYGYRLANAEVTKGSNIAVAAKNATITWTAKALAAAAKFTFADDAATVSGTINAGNATAVATAVAADGALAALVFNGISYENPVATGATVTWTADNLVGDITYLYELTDAQKKVIVAPDDAATVVGTEGDVAVAAKMDLTFVAAAGSKNVTALGVTAALTGKEDADLVAAAWLKAFNKKYPTNNFVYKTVALAKDPAIAGAVVTLEAVAVGATTGFKAAADAEKIAYDAVTANALKTALGADAYTPDALVYNIGGEITPILASYKFTNAQKSAFEFAVRAATSANSKYLNVTDTQDVKAYGLVFTLGYDADGFPQLVVYDDPDVDAMEFKSGTYVYVRVLNDEFANAQIEKEFRIKLVDPASTAVTKKILPAEKTIGVGQVLDLRTLSDSVKDVKTYWTVETYGDYQTKKEADLAAKIIIETNDANTTYGWSVKGLAPSVVTIKVYDSYRDMLNGKAADSMKLNIGKGTVAGPSISTTSASVKVGETVALNVKTTEADQYVKWAVSNENGALDVLEGASVKLTGKVAGNVVVTATVYEAKDSKIVEKTLTATVEVKAAEAGSTGSTGATQNPQTGDSIFAHLFF